MRKILTLIAALSLVASLAVGGTIAYLTDTELDANVMTLGNVDIVQHEYERVKNADGTYEMVTSENYKEDGYKLQEFTPNKPLLPATGKITGWGDPVYFDQLGKGASGGQYVLEGLNNVQDKFVLVENTGKTDAYVRTYIAFESGSNTKDLIGYSIGDPWTETGKFAVEIDSNMYEVIEYVYKGSSTRHTGGVLPAGEYTYNSLGQVYLKNEATNEDMIALDGNGNGLYDILVLSQAVQAEGFDDAADALNEAFGEATDDLIDEWFKDEGKLPVTTVATADELVAAIAEGGTVVLTADIAIPEDTTVAVTAGQSVTINLAGHTISADNKRTQTHNDLFLVKGTLNVTDGTVEYKHTGTNMGWNGCINAFDVTAGGVLNLDGVTVKASGTDMNFAVHLNNWGEVTLNADNCVFDSDYCGVRVFNSGYDMNNVKITNSTLKGASRAFWVHNYIGDLNSAEHSDEAIKARLNLDIFGNSNTFEITGTAKSPVRYGFNNDVFIDPVTGAVIE